LGGVKPVSDSPNTHSPPKSPFAMLLTDDIMLFQVARVDAGWLFPFQPMPALCPKASVVPGSDSPVSHCLSLILKVGFQITSDDSV
jgi:hypothetical protein